ncbi:MAG: lipocalin-like domain-containing protein [Cyanobacteria bacterium P01_H01_bin.35]
MTSPDKFVGTWKLLEFKTIDSGKTIYSMGENPEGYIIYTPDGHVSVCFMMRDRPKLGLSMLEMQELKNIKFGNLIKKFFKYLKATLSYFKASRNYVSYAGTYEIQDNQVVHHLTVSLIPDWVGIDLVRTFEFLEDRLILSPPVMGNVSSALTWQRIG